MFSCLTYMPYALEQLMNDPFSQKLHDVGGKFCKQDLYVT